MTLPKCFFAPFLVSVCLCAHPCFAQSAPPEADDEGLYVYLQSLNRGGWATDGLRHYNTPMPDYKKTELSNGSKTTIPHDNAEAYFYVKASPFPYVESYASAEDIPGFDGPGSHSYATAYFDLTYWVQVPGPAGNIVTIDAIVNQNTSICTHTTTVLSDVSACGSASVEITAASPGETQIGITSLGRSKTKFRQLSDTWFEVQMSTYDTVSAAYGAATSRSWTDPQFLIDPNTPDASLYSVVPEDGFGNAPATAVPEPSTWATMLTGFAILGFASWRASRKGARDETSNGSPNKKGVAGSRRPPSLVAGFQHPTFSGSRTYIAETMT